MTKEQFRKKAEEYAETVADQYTTDRHLSAWEVVFDDTSDAVMFGVRLGEESMRERAASLFDNGGSYNREQTFKGGADDEVSFTFRVGDIIGENIRALPLSEDPNG